MYVKAVRSKKILFQAREVVNITFREERKFN